MDRTKFYDTAVVNGVKELDFGTSSISKFQYQYPFSYHRVTESDLMRPDLISFKYYNTVQYWWVILRVNDVRDPYDGLVVGALLKIPSILDLYDIYKRWRTR